MSATSLGGFPGVRRGGARRRAGLYTDPSQGALLEHKGPLLSTCRAVSCASRPPHRTPCCSQPWVAALCPGRPARTPSGVRPARRRPCCAAPSTRSGLRPAAAGRYPAAVKVFRHAHRSPGHRRRRSQAGLDTAYAIPTRWPCSAAGPLSTLPRPPDIGSRYVETDATRSALASFTTADPTGDGTSVAARFPIGGRGPSVGSGATVCRRAGALADDAGVDGFNLAYSSPPARSSTSSSTSPRCAPGPRQTEYARPTLWGAEPRHRARHPSRRRPPRLPPPPLTPHPASR